MKRRDVRHPAVALVVGLASLLLASPGAAGAAQEATPAAGFDPTARFPAHLHAGTCDVPGDVAFPLAEAGYGLPVPIAPAATPGPVTATTVGSGSFNVAAVSVTTLAASLDQLVGVEHAVDVHSSAEGGEHETRIVCGPVGGFRAGDDLVFGLGERNASNYAGTAWLHDNGDGTTTHFVVLASGLPNGDAGTGQGSRPDPASALEGVSAPVEVTGIVVAGGGFAVEEVLLREGVPTLMHVANVDDRDYRLRVGDLVTPTPLPAGAVTAIEFTTPTATTYQGQLLTANGDEVLATVRVAVVPPSELAP